MTAVLMPITAPRLDQVLDRAAGARRQGAADRADHPRGDGGGEAERIADGDRHLPRLQRRRIAEIGGRQRRVRVRPQQGEVGVRVVPD
jgi:hypothetical protein